MFQKFFEVNQEVKATEILVLIDVMTVKIITTK